MNKKKNRHKWDKKELKAAYLFTLPSFIGFMCFVLIPIIWVIVISFHKYNVFTGASTFIGLENYKKIFTDIRSLTALKNTLWYTICCSLGNTAIIWQAFFQTDAGVINYYLGQLGIAKIGWLNDQAYSKLSVLILDIWKNSGMSMLLILAGLQNVDQGLLEAASIDGANVVQRFFKIIIPVASPQIFFVLVMNVTGALRIYESIYVLTNGGPGDSSRSLVMLIAEKGFTSFDYGTASALSIMLLILIGIVTVFQFVGSRWWVHYE